MADEQAIIQLLLAGQADLQNALDRIAVNLGGLEGGAAAAEAGAKSAQRAAVTAEAATRDLERQVRMTLAQAQRFAAAASTIGQIAQDIAGGPNPVTDATSIIGAAASGAASGAQLGMLGGPKGMAIGAVVGGLASGGAQAYHVLTREESGRSEDARGYKGVEIQQRRRLELLFEEVNPRL